MKPAAPESDAADHEADRGLDVLERSQSRIASGTATAAMIVYWRFR